MCEQCRFRVCTRYAMINHWHDKHQAPDRDPIDEICYGTLESIPEDDTFKMQFPLYHPDLAQADKPKQQSCKELPAHTSSRDRHRSSRGYQRTQSRHRGRSHSRSQGCWSKCLLPRQPGITPHQSGGGTVQVHHQRVQVMHM